MKLQKKVYIVGIHQTYAKTYAGGYVRLREFLKNIPNDLEYNLIDNHPTIYDDIVKQENIISITSPKFVYYLIKKIFPIGVFAERIWSGFALYNILKKQNDIETALIYVPIGELLHLYLPAILLKRKMPNITLVIDILNFEIIKESFLSLIRRFRRSSSLLISFALAFVHYFSFKVTKNTINDVNFIFTVSPELIKVIREVYRKNTIDYTPSGVNIDNVEASKSKKKYLGVYMGRVTEQKGVYNLLSVWSQVIIKKPNAILAIAGLIGPDDNDHVRKIINESNMENNIKLLGTVTEKEKYQLLAESEIFIHLANYEPLFPVIGILEGLALGLPVIVFDMDVLNQERKKIKNNDFIYIVENNNIQKAANAVIKISALEEKKRVIIAKNAIRYSKQFDWKEIAKKEFVVVQRLAKI